MEKLFGKKGQFKMGFIVVWEKSQNSKEIKHSLTTI